MLSGTIGCGLTPGALAVEVDPGLESWEAMGETFWFFRPEIFLFIFLVGRPLL